MGKRLGVGAAAASAMIFSVILLSNFALYAASQDRARLYSESDAEHSLSISAVALMGAAGANVLQEAQSAIGSETLDCPTALGVIASEIGGLGDVQREGDLSVFASSRAVGVGYSTDNLSMLAPFNGSVASDLGISVGMYAVGKDSSAGVSMGKFESHLVHLPVRLGSLVADCLGSLRTLSEVASSTRLSNCTDSAITSVLAKLSLGLSTNASRDGFQFGLGFAIASTKPCSVSFQVSIEQADIQGLGGVFSVRMQAEELVSFAP
jgi:hypothetical protein